jgi:hypothetical protein
MTASDQGRACLSCALRRSGASSMVTTFPMQGLPLSFVLGLAAALTLFIIWLCA